jgi:hypothetical protein
MCGYPHPLVQIILPTTYLPVSLQSVTTWRQILLDHISLFLLLSYHRQPDRTLMHEEEGPTT